MNWQKDLTPAFELLLACARTNPAQTEIVSIRQRAHIIQNWDSLFELAGNQGVLPLVYTNLKSCCQDIVPPVVLEKMRLRFHANAHHNLLLSGELVRILDRFREHDIPAIPFKGPVLAVSAYGDLTLREFGDLDILVGKPNFSRVRELLLSGGYREDTTYATSWESTFVNPQNEVEIDVHWAFAPQHAGSFSTAFDYDIDGLWERHNTCNVVGRNLANLSTEDALLARCQNASKDFFKLGWPRLAWICDIAQLLRAHPQLDWDQVDSLAVQFGSRRVVYMCLLVARDLLEAPIQDRFLVRLSADSSARRLAQNVCERLLKNVQRPSDGSRDLDVISRFFFHLRVHERWRDKLPYIRHFTPMVLRRILTPGEDDICLVRLPTQLYALYYVLRPFRLMGKHGRRLLRACLK